LTWEEEIIVVVLENERLIQACCQNDIETITWLLENAEISSIDLRTGLNRSALHEAVLHRDGRSLVRLLCQYGADPKQRDSLG
jgi:ankyrin repeat protein